jgi:arsenic resistance protein ArsH
MHKAIVSLKLPDLPNVDAALFLSPGAEQFARVASSTHAPRIYDPEGLPLPDGHPEDHPKVQELRELAAWSEGMVWTSPERHGAMTGVMKAQIDWIPLALGSVRPTQGKTLAAMEVSGGSQSFNAVDQLRILGRWMRMITIPNQSSVAKAYLEFDENDGMKPSAYYERVLLSRQSDWRREGEQPPQSHAFPEFALRTHAIPRWVRTYSQSVPRATRCSAFEARIALVWFLRRYVCKSFAPNRSAKDADVSDEEPRIRTISLEWIKNINPNGRGPQQALVNVRFQAVNPDTANYLTEHRSRRLSPRFHQHFV